MFAAIEQFRERLKAGELLVGTTVTLSDSLVIDAIADSVDFLWIDQEHTPVGPESLRTHMLAIRGRSKPALVRVSGPGPEQIKPVLDAGAHGVIVPQPYRTRAWCCESSHLMSAWCMAPDGLAYGARRQEAQGRSDGRHDAHAEGRGRRARLQWIVGQVVLRNTVGDPPDRAQHTTT